MKTTAVIGKNYGDEGKGLVASSLCSFYENPLIIKSNGGGQAGHTVESLEKRFVHHQTGSGAEYGNATLFAETYHPDIYKLIDEINDFKYMFGFAPIIYSEAKTCITLIDDVLINMAIETERGVKRHGSCGMGINECGVRLSAGYGINVGEVAGKTEEAFLKRLIEIRKEYTLKRIEDLGISSFNKYFDLLTDENILNNYSHSVYANLSYVTVLDADKGFLNKHDALIFENGQGLLLDQDYLKNAPHLTASKTGIEYPVEFLAKRDLTLDEAVYVTRTYVTRHGAGPLPDEFNVKEHAGIMYDKTNESNEWQGNIRYGYHENIEKFKEPVFSDIGDTGVKASLAITHLNETNEAILFKEREMPIHELIEKVKSCFSKIYVSDNCYGLNNLI